MSLGTLLGGIKYLPTIVLVLIVALPVTFIAMNPSGALDIVVTTGQFIVTTIMDVIKGGFAALWWLFQALWTGIANLLIGAGNLVIQAINNFAVGWLVPNWSPIPTFPYLQAPEISPTIQSIVDEIMQGYTNLKIKISDYWTTVQSNAPMSYVSGAVAGGGSAGATYLLAQETSEKTRMAITPKKKRKSSKSPKIITLSSKSSSARKSSSSRKSSKSEGSKVIPVSNRPKPSPKPKTVETRKPSKSSSKSKPRDIYLELLEPEYVSKQRKMPKKTTKTEKTKTSKRTRDIYLELLEPEYVSKQRKMPKRAKTKNY